MLPSVGRCGRRAGGACRRRRRTRPRRTPAERRVVIAVLPYGVPIEAIGGVDGISPGVMSAAIGSAPPAQSFLDIGQGNRINERLYDSDLLPVYVREGRLEPGVWDRIRERAEDAPADVIPGLLGSTLEAAGLSSVSEPADGLAPLIAVDRDGQISLTADGACEPGCPPGMSGRPGGLRGARRPRRGARRGRPADRVRGREPQRAAAVAHRDRGQRVRREPDLRLHPDRRRGTRHRRRADDPRVAGRRGARRDERQRDPGRGRAPTRRRSRSSRSGSRTGRAARRWAFCRSPPGCCLRSLRRAAFRGRVARTAFTLFGLACAWAPLLLLVAAAVDAERAGVGAADGRSARRCWPR